MPEASGDDECLSHDDDECQSLVMMVVMFCDEAVMACDEAARL
jgi:hypothetical protein